MNMDLGESGSEGASQHALIGQMRQQPDELDAARDQTEICCARYRHRLRSRSKLDAASHRHHRNGIDRSPLRCAGRAGSDETWTQFVHAGMEADTVQRIGHLPVGKGVLGLPLDQASVLRLDDLTTHPAAVGFPEHHPQMDAFLAVPITIRGTPVARLHLTDDRPSRTFAPSADVAARTLAAAAGVAIDHAQMFERARASAEWTDASREIISTLLSGVDPPLRPLQLSPSRCVS